MLADVLHLLDRAVGADVLNSSVAVPLALAFFLLTRPRMPVPSPA